MDLISKLCDAFYNVVWKLNEPFCDFFVRAAFMLILAYGGCWGASRLGNRLIGVQWAVLLAALLIGSIVPITDIRFPHKIIKAWTLVVCGIVILLMPFYLSMTLFPTAQDYKYLCKLMYCFLGVSFVLNTLYAGYVQWIR